MERKALAIREVGATPPPVLWQKRLQAAENKRRVREKESQEGKRGRKLLRTLTLPQRPA